MEYLWGARNTMEHGTSEEERSLHKTARINVRLKRAYEKKGNLHFVSRNQLFNVPLSRHQQYTQYKNERWLELVEAAEKNRRRQKEKLNESLSTPWATIIINGKMTLLSYDRKRQPSTNHKNTSNSRWVTTTRGTHDPEYFLRSEKPSTPGTYQRYKYSIGNSKMLA